MIHGIFNFESVPKNYIVCFAAECPLREQCMRYQAGLVLPAGMEKGYSIFPTACRNGQCRHFAQVREVQAARGFTTIFDRVRRNDFQPMTSELMGYLGTGGTYYRYRNGERLLMPEQQEWIRQLFSRYGYDEEVTFDSILTTYDFT